MFIFGLIQRIYKHLVFLMSIQKWLFLVGSLEGICSINDNEGYDVHHSENMF